MSAPRLAPTIGPFTIDLDELFDKASAAVLARADIADELETMQDPPDIGAVIDENRAVILNVVDLQFSAYASVTRRLHEQLVEHLDPATRDRFDELSTTSGAHPEEQVQHRKELQALLEAALPAAREQLEFRSTVTEWEATQRGLLAGLESEMLSVALGALNTALAESTSAHMKVTSFDGLRESVTTERIVITDAYEVLETMIRERDEGSIGIAGPRGVGKSTLLRYFTTTRGVRELPGTEEHDLSTWNRPRLGLLVSAPVAYEPRDFVLHLYATLCETVIGEDRTARLRREGELSSPPGVSALARGALTALGAGGLAAGVGLLAIAVLHRLPWSWHLVPDAGAGLFALAVCAVMALVRPTSQLIDPRVREHVREAGTAWIAATSVVLVAGLTLLLAGGGWPGGTWEFVLSGALLVGGYTAWRVAVVANRVTQVGLLVENPRGERLFSPYAQLREWAYIQLRQIRYQQTFSRERSTTVRLGGGAGLSVGLDASGKRGESWQGVPKSYPELVADLRTFLTAVAQQHILVVGVDELDKLRSHDDVENFLNDIKGIFGTAGCFFLVSVSEDAAAGFERRGAPFRDVFDSTFDDVIALRHLDLRYTRKIVHGLLLGWTKPFVGLCFVLSGGLARDLRRSVRELVSHRDDDGGIELASAALAMCRREGQARLDAIRHELRRDPSEPLNVELLARLADLTPLTATHEDLLSWHDDLSTWSTPAQHRSPTARLGLEMAAFLLFAATVVEFFDPATVADRIHEAERPDAGAKSLATLATSRHSLASSPSMAVAYTDRFRAAWGLPERSSGPRAQPG